jgi:CMP-N-acetylneuraminic acid synthetase/spore coat polysaccharide biosynthesis predicted glycosyltransferase SpsG
MYKNNKILAVIPGRGGSKGIPRKVVRLLAGKPLIAYSIQTALQSKYVDTVVVSTEDAEIAEIAKSYDSDIVRRPVDLANDDVPLDPVIFHALNQVELRNGITYDYVISMQPTSPLLTRETLDTVIAELIDGGYDTLITVRNETGLYWTRKNGEFVPLYQERKNRQLLNPIYRETGALLISRKDIITEKSRIGTNIRLFEVPMDEKIDIDTYQDWWVAENLLKRLDVVFRVDGDKDLGLGHVYRAITLANRIFNQNLYFLMDESKKLGIEKVSEYNYPITTIANENDAFLKLDKIHPNIVINDILDTNENYILKLKEKGFFVVNFEDLGAGADCADVVVNALYEKSEPPHNSYYGYKYVCLRDEFFIFNPKEIEKEVKNILLLFGGSDPNNLTLRSLKAIEKLSLENISVSVILGLGYGFKNKLDAYVNRLKGKGFKIEMKENVKPIAKLLSKSDVVLTSNGRTIYEVAAMGVPCISISQNEREVRHLFSHTCKGIMDLGIESNVSEKKIASALRQVLDDYPFRQRMSDNLKSFDLKKGTDIVLRLIFDKYWEEKNEKS